MLLTCCEMSDWMVSWRLEVLLVVEQGKQCGITLLQCVKGNVPSCSFPISSQATGSLGCRCSRKPTFVCCSYLNQLYWWWARWKRWSWPQGCCRCSGHCPFISYRSSPRGGEQLRSPAALGQGEANCWAAVSPTAVGPQLAGWRQETLVEDGRLISQANSCGGRRSPYP